MMVLKMLMYLFWFNNEEEDHLKYVWKQYMKSLKVEQKCRCFDVFIGTIKRQKVENFEDFMTLDKVDTYKRDPARPLGETMPFSEALYVLTTWNSEGEPINIKELNKSNDLEIWKNRLCKNVSYILCNPVWEKGNEYYFSVSKKDKSVGYANEPFNYSRYVTKKKDEDNDDSSDDGVDFVNNDFYFNNYNL